MATPLSMESSVGYVSAEDLYVVFREYYGDGTIYGRVDLLDADGQPARGAGKSKKQLVDAGVLLSETWHGSISGDLMPVPDFSDDSSASAPAPEPAPESAPECAPECAPESAPESAPEVSSSRYTVTAVIAGFTVSRELNVKINEKNHTIYLSE